MGSTIATRVTKIFTYSFKIRDRTGRPFLVRLSPLRRGDELIGAVATFVDITPVRGTARQRRAAAR